MAKRPQFTKLLAVVAMTTSPALAGPEHGHGPSPPTAEAAQAPAARPAEGRASRAQPQRAQQGARARPASTAPAEGPATPASTAPAAAAAAPGASAEAPPAARAVPGLPAALEALFGIARPRELPNGRPAPGNVQRRTASRSER